MSLVIELDLANIRCGLLNSTEVARASATKYCTDDLSCEYL